MKLVTSLLIVTLTRPTLELCKKAKTLYKTRSLSERADLLKRLVSNPRQNGLNIEFDLKKTFGVLAKINKIENWCDEGDLNPHAFRHMPLKHACLPFHHRRT